MDFLPGPQSQSILRCKLGITLRDRTKKRQTKHGWGNKETPEWHMTLTSNFFQLSIQICKLTFRKLLYTQSSLRYHIDRCLSRSHRGTLYLSPQPFLLQHSLARRASRWGTVAFSQSICTVNFLIFLSLNFHHNPLMWRNLRKMDSQGMKSTKDSSNYFFNSLVTCWSFVWT